MIKYSTALKKALENGDIHLVDGNFLRDSAALGDGKLIAIIRMNEWIVPVPEYNEEKENDNSKRRS